MKIEVDKAVWNKMKQRLLKDNLELRCGWFEGDRYGPENNNMQVAEVARLNEQGHINGPDAAFPGAVTPPRPFLRVGFMKPVQQGIYDSYFVESLQRIAEGKSTFLQEYKKLGPMVRKDLQDVISEYDFPKNSPTTVGIKGFDDPLILSGTMHDSVGWMVAPSGPKEGGD